MNEIYECECGAEVKQEGDICHSCEWMMDK